jgi:hypothetical protein
VKGVIVMRDRSEALKTIGLPEDASRQQIENRYFHLVKKYKYLEHDEQPSPREPIFAVINEAYRFLIGFTPMQKTQFRELKWKEKLLYIREYYMIEMIVVMVLVLSVFAIGMQINLMSKAIQTGGTKNPGLSSKVNNTSLISDHNGTDGKFP